MTGQRIVILDASHSLFAADLSSLTSNTTTPAQPDTDALGLQPIPGFAEIIMDAIRDVAATGKAGLGTVAPVDVGVVCDAGAVRALGRVIHERVRARLGL